GSCGNWPNHCCRSGHACLRRRRGTYVAGGKQAMDDVAWSGGVLVQGGVRAIPFGIGIATMLLGFALKSAGTQAGPADAGVPAPRMSVFGTIHQEIFRLSAPLGSEPAERVRLASLEPLVGFEGL